MQERAGMTQQEASEFVTLLRGTFSELEVRVYSRDQQAMGAMRMHRRQPVAGVVAAPVVPC